MHILKLRLQNKEGLNICMMILLFFVCLFLFYRVGKINITKLFIRNLHYFKSGS